MKKWWVALAVLLLAVVGFFPFQTIHDDGLWPLVVRVHSASGKPINAVSAEAFGEGQSAEYVLEHLAPPETGLYSATQAPLHGDDLLVHIPVGDTVRSSLLRDYHRLYQYSRLVVIVEYEDGKREGRLVEIPDLRRSREVVVEFP
jgi:hypothetical protein